MMYAKNVFAIRNDVPQKMRCLLVFLRIFSRFHGIAFNFFWCVQSPSIQYSIRRNTISMKMVCGHTHPQKRRPYTTVNRVMKMIMMIAPMAKRYKSCGQKTFPKRTNFLSRILKRKSCSPPILMWGAAKSRISRK